jgi:hypothetical protein
VISENSQGLRGLKLHASIDSSRASNFNRLMCFAPPAANNLPNVSITSCAASAQKTPAPYLYSGAVFLGRITQVHAFMPFWGPASPGGPWNPWNNVPSTLTGPPALKGNFSPNR